MSRALEPFRRLIEPAVMFVRDCIAEFVELQGVDRALALAAQAFTALIPVLILVASFQSKGEGKGVADNLIERLDLDGASADAVRQAFAAPETVTASATFIGIFILIFSALSFTRALQRLFERSWDLQARGMRSTAWGLGWLVMFSLYWSILGALDPEARRIASFIAGFFLWLVTPYILLERRIAPRRLIPQAALTSLGMLGVSIWTSIYMGRAVASTAEQFGAVGVSFALLTWLVVLAFAIVIATTIGVVAQRWIERFSARQPE